MAHSLPDPGVYRFMALIDGCAAFYIVDWHGVESDVRIVEEGETESQVVAELLDVLGERPSRRRGDRKSEASPRLFLV